MGDAKRLIVRPISAGDARRVVSALHYSGKTVNNSQVHLGVFLDGRCGGALQFGPSLDKRKLVGLVEGTLWNEFIELNRMALADWLPRNGESRVIGFAMRWLRKEYPFLKWVVSFADAAQCGDGTIYRASGFVLTGIRKNTSLWVGPAGHVGDDVSVKAQAHKPRVFSRTALTDNRSHLEQAEARKVISRTTHTDVDAFGVGGGASMRDYKAAGFAPIPGFQLRYVYFLDPACRGRLTVPVLPFSEIERLGATMYKGMRPKDQAPAVQAGLGGETPTRPLQSPAGKKAQKVRK